MTISIQLWTQWPFKPLTTFEDPLQPFASIGDQEDEKKDKLEDGEDDKDEEEVFIMCGLCGFSTDQFSLIGQTTYQAG